MGDQCHKIFFYWLLPLEDYPFPQISVFQMQNLTPTSHLTSPIKFFCPQNLVLYPSLISSSDVKTETKQRFSIRCDITKVGSQRYNFSLLVCFDAFKVWWCFKQRCDVEVFIFFWIMIFLQIHNLKSTFKCRI